MALRVRIAMAVMAVFSACSRPPETGAPTKAEAGPSPVTAQATRPPPGSDAVGGGNAGVSVLGREQIGGYDVARLAASDLAALMTRGGSIVLNGSINAHIGMPNSSVYAASKAAGDLLVRAYCRTFHANAVITM